MEAQAQAELSAHSGARAAEHELLLCCTRTQADAATAARIRSLSAQKLDWEYLLRAAYRHALTALLYYQLNAHARDAVPPHYLSELKRRFQANAARNLFLTKELCRILRLFASEGISVVPYKGPALAVAAYGNLSLRHFIDLDILVPKREVLRAKGLLLSSGYSLEPPLTDAQQAVVLRTQHNLPFVSHGRLVVELHWEVAAKKFSDALDAEGMWERLEKVTLAGETVEGLAPEDALPALCVHGSKHFWERLAWVCDVAELIRATPTLDWRRITSKATGAGYERMLFLGLRLAAELLGAPLPEEVRRAVFADRAVARLARQVREQIFDEGEPRTGIARALVFNLRARRRLRDKVGYFGFVFAPTDGDLTLMRLPASLSFVYYLLRPFRLLIKGNVKH
jgi:hypothetical protein